MLCFADPRRADIPCCVVPITVRRRLYSAAFLGMLKGRGGNATRIWERKGIQIMDTMKTGALIAQKRKEQNLTQQQLADLLGVTNKAVSKWETGDGFPDVSLLLPLAQALGVTADTLLKGEECAEDLSSSHTPCSDPEAGTGLRVISLISLFLSVLGTVVSYFLWLQFQQPAVWIVGVVLLLISGISFGVCATGIKARFGCEISRELKKGVALNLWGWTLLPITYIVFLGFQFVPFSYVFFVPLGVAVSVYLAGCITAHFLLLRRR